MKYKILLLFASVLLLCGCGRTFHMKLPDNHIYFPAEGGAVEYIYSSGLSFSDVLVDGERHCFTSLYVESEDVGGCWEWISIIDGGKTGNHGVYTIEVKSNPEKQARSAILNVSNCNNYGEIYIYQEGRSE